jgi:hypothetical protein
MKKLIVSFSLVIAAFTAFGQRLKTVKLDTLVSVTLPADYHTQDTLDEQTYTANAQYGYIIVGRSPNPSGNTTLKKEKELNNVFKEYIRKVRSSLPDGIIQNDHDTIIHNIEVRDFTLSTDTGSGIQLRRFRILYTKPVTYTFQYLYDDMRKDIATDEMNTFFKSIKISPDFNGTDQFTLYGKHGRVNSLIVILVAGGAVVLLLIVLIAKKRRRTDVLLNDVMEEE